MVNTTTQSVQGRNLGLGEPDRGEYDRLTAMNLSRLVHRFFRLAAINILSNLTVPLAGLISVAFLGHLAEIRHLTGVTLSTILFNYLYRTLGFLRMGTTGIVAQAVGRGDRDAVLLTGLRNGLLALVLGLAILLLQHPLQILGFALLSGTPEVESSGMAYYDARIWAAPATLLNFVLIGWFLGREQSSKVLLLSVVGNGANIILDYLFIVRWGWESGGAGAATAISQYLTALTGLLLVALEIKPHEWFAIGDRLFNPSELKTALTLNGNIFIRTFAFLSTFAIFTNLSAVLGTEILAKNALLLQVVMLTVYLIDGLAFATESLAGILAGQENRKHLTVLLRIAGSTSLGLGLSLAFLFIAFPKPLFGILTNHAEILHPIETLVPWLLPVLGFGSIAFILDGYFLGLTEGAILRDVALIAAFLGFLPVAIVAWRIGSNHLLWFALNLFMVVRAGGLLLKIPATLNRHC